MRWIYISPHLDDAVLSAGGFLYEQEQAGFPVEVWNIVCGFPPPGELTPLAHLLHFTWGTGSAEDTVKLRRAEDEAATRRIGVKTFNFDVPDCIYRRGPDGEPLYPDIYMPPHPAESGLMDQIAGTIAPRLQADDQILCQLGVGKHVDHILVRQAVERLNHPLWYVADLPYLFKLPGQLGPLVAGMKKSLHVITEAGLQTWIEAVMLYESQLSSLFENNDQIEREIRSFYAEHGGFPLWQLVQKYLASSFKT